LARIARNISTRPAKKSLGEKNGERGKKKGIKGEPQTEEPNGKSRAHWRVLFRGRGGERSKGKKRKKG